MTGTLIDVTGSSLPGLLSALTAYPDVMAGYVTGSPDIDWTGQQWGLLAGKCGHFRYDQSPGLSLFASGAADGADVEDRAGTIPAAVTATRAREAKGWWSWWYVNQANIQQARDAVHIGGLKKVQFIVANWNLNQQQATAQLGGDVVAIQWASPSSNPRTICPGTNRTLADLNCDLNVTIPGWFALPKPPPPATKRGIVVTSLLETIKVNSMDGGKTWQLNRGLTVVICLSSSCPQWALRSLV